MKSYTDIEQSKKLAEILSFDSADMSWVSCDDGRQKYYQAENRKIILMYEKKHWIPCWSLAALLDVLSKCAECVNEAGIAELSYEKITKWCISMLNCGKIKDCYTDNPVDACVAMIERLHELKML